MKKLLILLLCFICVELGTCLQCYTCSTKNKEEKCNDPFVKDEHVVYMCDEVTAVCLKEKTHSDGYQDSVHRGCAVADYCTLHGSKSQLCSTCTQDFCNSSSVAVPSSIALTVFLIMYYV